MRKDEDLSEGEDLDDRLPEVPKDSPQEESNHHVNNRFSHKGAVATPLAQVLNTRGHTDIEGEEDEERPHQAQEHKGGQEKHKPEVAPKPGKEKPPVAKVSSKEDCLLL